MTRDAVDAACELARLASRRRVGICSFVLAPDQFDGESVVDIFRERHSFIQPAGEARNDLAEYLAF